MVYNRQRTRFTRPDTDPWGIGNALHTHIYFYPSPTPPALTPCSGVFTLTSISIPLPHLLAFTPCSRGIGNAVHTHIYFYPFRTPPALTPCSGGIGNALHTHIYFYPSPTPIFPLSNKWGEQRFYSPWWIFLLDFFKSSSLSFFIKLVL